MKIFYKYLTTEFTNFGFSILKRRYIHSITDFIEALFRVVDKVDNDTILVNLGKELVNYLDVDSSVKYELDIDLDFVSLTIYKRDDEYNANAIFTVRFMVNVSYTDEDLIEESSNGLTENIFDE